MEIKFTKMQGCANDYIYINCLEGIPFDPEKLSREMSPRHSSVGADGIILICSSDVADAKMRIFNLDGSEGKMCGNGIRCVGKYLYDNGIIRKTKIDVETLSGIKHLDLTVNNGKVTYVTVDMGKAEINAAKIPVISETEEMIDTPVTVNGEDVRLTCVSMGNPHAVAFVQDVKSLNLEKIGPGFEHHEIFPERVNTEFIRVIGRTELEMRVWERGSGETYACGTGTCAAVVAAILNGYCDYETTVKVHLVGGDLEILVKKDMTVYMTGPAVTVYEGIYDYED